MHEVGVTRNGVKVNVNLTRSRAALPISQRPHLLTLVGELLSELTLDDKRLVISKDMGRPVGYDFVIEVTDPESVFYAQLAKGTIFIPFTKKGNPAPTNLLTIVIEHTEEDGYCLDDLWLGPFRPALPGDSAEADDSKTYWSEHAHIFEDQHIKASSITRDCPYLNDGELAPTLG